MSKLEAQYIVSPFTLNDGQATTALCDSSGRLMVAEQFAAQAEDNANGVIAVQIKPFVGSGYTPTVDTNIAAVNARLLKTGSGNVFSIIVDNNNSLDRFIQIFNKATVPVNADVPLLSIRIKAQSSVAIGRDSLGQAGLYVTSSGIGAAFSTTATTLTLGAAADVIWSIQYK